MRLAADEQLEQEEKQELSSYSSEVGSQVQVSKQALQTWQKRCPISSIPQYPSTAQSIHPSERSVLTLPGQNSVFLNSGVEQSV